ncbi:sulfate transporter CysZ [Aliagarivorans marinus]|uniref:sulfate transporter CysZ n=1 Tax=Aliagarivorans marinus TaxID=561965 RepID=UPI000426F181|nr:sulfate transporter CysZ [Aliagarivorans marinus]
MNHKQIASKSGISYFFQGLNIIKQPGIRPFVVLPLLVNLLLFFGLYIYIFYNLGAWIDQILAELPSWLSWLKWLLWPLITATVLLLTGFSFGILANWIAAPFNGLLAEKVEASLSGENLGDTTIWAVMKDLPRILKREWQKLWYWLPKALGLLLLFLIPAVGQTIAPLLWFLFTAWMMAIQYIDYPFDNHKVAFANMRDELKQDRLRNLGFGAVVVLLSSVPLVNILVMPIAVAAATAIWVEHYRPQHVANSISRDDIAS